jgi:uncharacterized protein YdeI (BOF family)
MKWYGLTGIFILLILTALVIQAASAKEEPAEFKNESVKIIDILENQSAIDSKMVVVEGKIELECASGCWFVLNDDTASIYIDILPNNFVIPQKSGSKAKVYGEVAIKNGDPQIIGKIVEIGGEIYR